MSSQERNTTEISKSIFRAYDIRGIFPDNLNETSAYLIGQAIGSEALAQNQQTLAIARDGRSSSPILSKALIAGVCATGCNVINLGIAPTPVLYFGTYILPTQSGIMITGSHNPAHYNGFKIVIAGQTIAEEQLQQLYQRIINKQFTQGQGKEQQQNILDKYLQRVTQDIKLPKLLRVVVDCGNGVTGVIAPQLFKSLNCEVDLLFTEVNGEFPNHHPDPSNPKNLQTLIQQVSANQADLGIAFDGDGDRIGVVTSTGEIIHPDRLMMLYAKDLLQKNPNGTIIFDVKCTTDLPKLIQQLGGQPIMWRTGHSLIKAKLKTSNAILAGEMSGHIFFNDHWYGFDDALYSAVRLLEILSCNTLSPATIFAELPNKVNTPEINIPILENEKFQFIENLIQNSHFSGGIQSTIDGIRIDYPDGWGLIRASNTTPNLVARFEATNEQRIQEIKTIFKKNMLAVNANLKIPF